MKKFTAIAVTALLLGQNPALVFAAEAATVKSVRVSADSVYIATDRPVEYKAFTMEQPPKLVLERVRRGVPSDCRPTRQEMEQIFATAGGIKAAA